MKHRDRPTPDRRQKGELHASSGHQPKAELKVGSTVVAGEVLAGGESGTSRLTEAEVLEPADRKGMVVPGWVLGGLLVAAVILFYKPVWKAGFIWDDDVYVTGNQLLTAPDGLKRIWFSQDSPSQYFPLVYTTFRLEHQLWRLRPEGYHWVNILLHASNALLLWRLLVRLKIPGAWLGAALFALHPVQVESVAWVTERKNVLSLFFVLLSLLGWERFNGDERKRRWLFYGLSLGAYLFALFSKTTACTLPAALLLMLWVKRKPINVRTAIHVAPYVVIGLAMGLLTIWWERHHIGTSANMFALGPLSRMLIASRAVWFYAAKLLWPAHLSFSYPRWQINPADPLAYSWLAAGVALVAVIYFGRKYFGRSVETAAVYYVATLSPLLGFVMLFTFRYTFVADHYQYVASIGPLTLLAAGISSGISRWLRGSSTEPSAAFRPAIYLVLLLALGLATSRQARAYRDLESIWRDTIAKNPDSWLAHANLGRYLMHKGQYEEAMQQYQETLRLNPRDVDSLVSVGNALFGKGQHAEASKYYEKALEVNPDNPEAHVNLGVILANRGGLQEAIEHDRHAIQINPRHLTAHVNLAVALARTGKVEEALEHYRQALEINPNQPLTHINLAIALRSLGRTNEAMTHFSMAAVAVNKHAEALAQQGRVEDARAQYTEAIRLIPNNAEAHCRLGALLARQGKREEAQAHFAEAIRIKPDYVEAQQQFRALISGENRPP
jgi:tetratricopeptide (TPR) repeat protein